MIQLNLININDFLSGWAFIWDAFPPYLAALFF